MNVIKNKILNCINGFTLAEVLITLVIIGVIAALTIPTAINNTKNQELKTQFAKAYSTISQAVYKTEMNDFFGYAECFYGEGGLDNQMTNCGPFYTALSKNLQVQKVCNGNAMADGCVPVYQSYASGGCGGFSESYINNILVVYVLSNGQIIIPWYYSYSGGMALFMVDINGHKGPNAAGKDLFSFRLKRKPDTSLYLAADSCQPTVSGGKSSSEMILYSLSGKK